MNRSFLRFNDSALSSGILSLRPELARELKVTTETFVKLARAAAVNGNNNDDDFAEADLDAAAELQHATATARSSHESHTIQAIRAAEPVPKHTDIGWGYSAQLDDSPKSSPRETLSPTTYFPAMRNSSFATNNDTSLLHSNSYQKVLSTSNTSPKQSTELQTSNQDNQALPFGLIDALMHSVSPDSIQPHTYFATVPPPNMSPPPTRTPTPPAALPTLGKQLTLRAPYTYSFQETTFARRLARAAIERGFHLLSMASLRPAAVNHVFKLSLPYITHEQMLHRFRCLLTKSSNEPLECWQTPFIHLGGAGTHYPRRDEHGDIIQPPNSWNVRSIGPLRKLRLESTVDQTLNQELDIDLRGFEGEWFDAHDVEGYLEEKGVRIDPQASFAEALIDADDNPDDGLASLVYSSDLNINFDVMDVERTGKVFEVASPTYSSGSGYSTSGADSIPTNSPPRTPSMSMLDQVLAQSDAPYGLDMSFQDLTSYGTRTNVDTTGMFEPLGLDLGGGFDNGGFADMGFNLGLGAEPVPVKKKVPAVVDVSKLIEELVKRGVCLGRAPGFRRKDVDLAFKASLIPAF
ncbi:hypothetical protein AOQ84DRAFT_172376 [Glonium stellatum]|uniref:Uncharacterized protein n=1 Tax=Glonium stellatum TaxID=574774 RepID=A0A8E2F7D5_9PEZI|nr:hypothetical protein AOQ84DRAFT_172376 [Glonium stellatum]